MENRAEFCLGKRIFLEILGNLGRKIDPRDLSKKTRASGYNGHGKRDKVVRERRGMSNIFGKPRILFIGRLNRLRTRGVRSYAARTRTSCVTEASTASASDGTGCWGGGSDGTAGRTGRSFGRVGRFRTLRIVRRGRSETLDLSTRGVRRYAGRTSVQSDDSPSDITGNL